MSDGFSLASAGRALDGAISRLVHDLVAPPPAPGEEWNTALAQYRSAREQTISIICDLTQAQADFSAAPNVWSIGQNVEHLLLTEKLYRTQIENLIDLARKGGKTNIDLTFQQIDTSIAFIPREVMPIFTMPLKVFNMFVPQAVRETMFRIPFIPAVSPSVSAPARSRPIAELRSRAVSSLEATEEVFRRDLPPSLGNMTLSHPILGTNNIVQIFRIISAHEERHQGQMQAVLGNPRFPK
jgi:DinB superfamily